MQARDETFERDGQTCRICQVVPMRKPDPFPLEWAHLEAKGMGGNPDDSRNTAANTICCCRTHHTGRRSLHSGHIKWRFLTEDGANGAMAFAFCERLAKAECGVRDFWAPHFADQESA